MMGLTLGKSEFLSTSILTSLREKEIIGFFFRKQGLDKYYLRVKSIANFCKHLKMDWLE